jgi:hypothetical protein
MFPLRSSRQPKIPATTLLRGAPGGTAGGEEHYADERGKRSGGCGGCSAPERPSTTTRGHSEQESATTRTRKARRRSLSLLLGAARHVGDRTRASLPGSRDGTTRGLVHACAWCTPRCCARYMARGRVHHDRREDQYASVWMRHHLAEWPARVLLSAWARQRRYLLHFLFHLRIFENAILQKVTTNLKISKNKSCRGAINL